MIAIVYTIDCVNVGPIQAGVDKGTCIPTVEERVRSLDIHLGVYPHTYFIYMYCVVGHRHCSEAVYAVSNRGRPNDLGEAQVIRYVSSSAWGFATTERVLG